MSVVVINEKNFSLDVKEFDYISIELVKNYFDLKYLSFNGNGESLIGSVVDSGSKSVGHNQKAPYIVKWLADRRIGDVFELEQFYKVYPKQRYNPRLWEHINDLIDAKVLTQLGKFRFRVSNQVVYPIRSNSGGDR